MKLPYNYHHCLTPAKLQVSFNNENKLSHLKFINQVVKSNTYPIRNKSLEVHSSFLLNTLKIITLMVYSMFLYIFIVCTTQLDLKGVHTRDARKKGGTGFKGNL